MVETTPGSAKGGEGEFLALDPPPGKRGRIRKGLPTILEKN